MISIYTLPDFSHVHVSWYRSHETCECTRAQDLPKHPTELASRSSWCTGGHTAPMTIASSWCMQGWAHLPATSVALHGVSSASAWQQKHAINYRTTHQHSDLAPWSEFHSRSAISIARYSNKRCATEMLRLAYFESGLSNDHVVHAKCCSKHFHLKVFPGDKVLPQHK